MRYHFKYATNGITGSAPLDLHADSAQCPGMTGGPNPSIAGEAIRRALGAPEADAAHQHDVAADQAILDEAELRELDRADYYPGRAAEPEPAPEAEHRTVLDRVLRRNPR